MAYAFRRGTRAMAVTSSTTAVAFMANIFSPLMPIRGFGIYSGIIVPVNFLLVVMILPPATIWYERYIDGCFTNCCCKIFFCFKKTKKHNNEEEDKDKDVQIEVKQNDKDKYSCMQRIFNGYWNSAVKVCRWPIVVVFFCWFVFAA